MNSCPEHIKRIEVPPSESARLATESGGIMSVLAARVTLARDVVDHHTFNVPAQYMLTSADDQQLHHPSRPHRERLL